MIACGGRRATAFQDSFPSAQACQPVDHGRFCAEQLHLSPFPSPRMSPLYCPSPSSKPANRLHIQNTTPKLRWTPAMPTDESVFAVNQALSQR
jgi:hypothetical protein